jgi:methanogenic corrinoid protein MtbC1
MTNVVDRNVSWPSACADHIEHHKDAWARQVTERFLEAHPDWLQRYGERAHTFGIEDTIHHLDFLRGAIAARSPAAFAAYARWCRERLKARGVEPPALDETFALVGDVAGTSECGAVLRAHIAAGRAALDEPPSGVRVPRDGRLQHAQQVFTQAAVRGSRAAAYRVVEDTLRSGAPVTDVYTGIFEASQHSIGVGWESDRLSVAQEHLATAVTEYVMARVFGDYPAPGAERGIAIVAGVEGEMHQIAAHLVADVLAFDGWDVRFLGTNVPLRDLLDEVTRVRPIVVGLSATMLFNVPNVIAAVQSLKATVDTPPYVIVGGAAFQHSPGLAQEIGADGFGLSLTAARALVDRLTAHDRG